jgi:hypothetical protein
MWDVFLDDMGLDNSVELALTNLDLNEPVVEPVTFDDGDPLEGSSSTSTDVLEFKLLLGFFSIY